MNVRDLLLTLIRCAIKGETLDVDEVKGALSEEKMAVLYKIAKSHDVAHLVCYALEKIGIIFENSDTWRAFLKEKDEAILRYEMMKADTLEICACFDKNEIDYILLKGAVVRNYYPEPWMRTSCDIDILVRPKDLTMARDILKEQLNYRVESAITYHDISLYSPFRMHLELHHSIKENDEKYDKILEDVWEFSHPTSPQGQKHEQEKTHLLFHMIAHTAYHFATGGCGMRSVLDIWLLRQCAELDHQALNSLLEKSGLLLFYSKLSELGEYWFGEQKSACELVLEMEKYILIGGAYGTAKQGVAFKSAKKGSRLKYFWHRVFLPYESLAILYPTIKKHKMLTPFCQIARWFGVIFKSKKISNEMKRIVSADRGQIENISTMLDELGL